MSKILMGIAAVIVLAGAVFAFVHFSQRPAPGAVTAQNGWVVVKDSPRIKDPALVSTFGSWRLLCREVGPRRLHGKAASSSPTALATAPTRRCAVVVLMRNPGAPKGTKEWLNLRLQNNPGGAGTILVLSYAHGHPGETFVPLPNHRGDTIEVRVDKDTDTMTTNRCIKGICMTIGQLSPSGLDSILSARTIAVTLSATKSARAAEVHVPTDGLKAAFAALRQQPT